MVLYEVRIKARTKFVAQGGVDGGISYTEVAWMSFHCCFLGGSEQQSSCEAYQLVLEALGIRDCGRT